MRTTRFLSVLMLCSMVLSLAACGNQTNANQELDGIFPQSPGTKEHRNG